MRKLIKRKTQQINNKKSKFKYKEIFNMNNNHKILHKCKKQKYKLK